MSGHNKFKLSTDQNRTPLPVARAFSLAEIAYKEGRKSDAERLVDICHQFYSDILDRLDGDFSCDPQ